VVIIQADDALTQVVEQGSLLCEVTLWVVQQHSVNAAALEPSRTASKQAETVCLAWSVRVCLLRNLCLEPLRPVVGGKGAVLALVGCLIVDFIHFLFILACFC
jgi:hypothetical protein